MSLRRAFIKEITTFSLYLDNILFIVLHPILHSFAHPRPVFEMPSTIIVLSEDLFFELSDAVTHLQFSGQ